MAIAASLTSFSSSRRSYEKIWIRVWSVVSLPNASASCE